MLKINPQSWHYRLAYHKLTTAFFSGNRDLAFDFCTYFRHVLKPLTVIFTLIWLFSTTPVVAHHFFVYGNTANWPALDDASVLYALWFGVGFLMNMAAGILGLIGIAMFIVFLCIVGVDEVRERTSTLRSAKGPNIFTQRYRAFKDKVCPLVEFTDE